MTAPWNWPGSRWWRVDLHTHSPASYDFMPEADRDAKDWSAWVAAADQAGLHAVALTDHNTPDGVAHIQAAISAAGSNLVVFPGVEATVGGIHLLLILDPSSTRDDLVALLARLGVQPSSFGLQATCCTKSIGETIELATAHGAVVVAAHVNAPKGVVMMPAGQDRLNALKAPGLIAAELSPLPPVSTADWLDPTSPEVQNWLDGSQTGGRIIFQVWCSDSHSLRDAGRRFTWIKMTRPNAEGLRLALLDGDGSLRRAEASNPGTPNKHADLAIESIAISHAKYLGRSNSGATANPLTVAFNPWLNAVIGGRGTGKSTIVDLCRQTMRREHELNDSGESSLASAFQKRMQVGAERQSEGLLTRETVVEVTYRKDGERFVLSWDPQGRTTPISRLDGMNRIPEEGDIRERFPVRIYSQKQLFDLAKDPNALLTVIDDSAEVRGGDARRLLKETEAKYLSLRASARSLRAQAVQLPARTAALADVRRKLELLQEGGHATTLSEYRTRRRQDGTWESILRNTVDAVEAVGNLVDGRLEVADLDFGETATEDSASVGLRAAHETLRGVVAQLQTSLRTALDRASLDITRLDASDEVIAWRSSVAASEKAYLAVTDELSRAGITNPDEYRDLLRLAATLEHEISSLERQQVEANVREHEATETLEAYRLQRGEHTAKRRRFADSTSSDLVKVEIQAYARLDTIYDALRETLGIPHFEEDYRAIQEQLAPRVDDAWFERLDDVVARLRAVVENPQQHWPTKDKRFEAALRKLPPERLDRLSLLLPGDAVAVSFHDPREKRWRDLAQGSPGQQTAALLAFVLGYGAEPIILDQPEDDLDNRLIYELLVRRLRETKPTRQVIVVTHNPNIVVHGDAELVISLEANKGQTRIAFAGGLQQQEAREEICRVMEGGRDAFETRYRRIMLPGGRRDGLT